MLEFGRILAYVFILAVIAIPPLIYFFRSRPTTASPVLSAPVPPSFRFRVLGGGQGGGRRVWVEYDHGHFHVKRTKVACLGGAA